MKKVPTALSIIFLMTSCYSIHALANENPQIIVPTDEFISIGMYHTKSKSYAIAFKEAKKFCRRWHAAPSVVRKQLKYQGALQEDTNSATTILSTVGEATGHAGYFDNDAYETTLTYKCY